MRVLRAKSNHDEYEVYGKKIREERRKKRWEGGGENDDMENITWGKCRCLVLDCRRETEKVNWG